MHQPIPYTDWQKILQEGAAYFGQSLSEQQMLLFYRHAELLLRWNRRMNLTAIRDPRMMAVNHFIDSFGPVRYFAPMRHVLDVGSGGGFPGLPLKICCPSIDLTLVDASRKKVSFLQHAIRELGLREARAVQERVEGLSGAIKGPLYDTIVCRAFSGLAFIVAQLPPLLADGGQILVWKGRLPREEIREVQPMLAAAGRALTLSVQSYRLPFSNADRTLVVLSTERHGAKEP